MVTLCQKCVSFKEGTIGIGWCNKKARARRWNDPYCGDYKRKPKTKKSEVKVRTFDGSEVKEEEILKTIRDRKSWKTPNKEVPPE